MSNVRSMPLGPDRAGLLLSAGCAVHCALMPFAAGALSLMGVGFVAGETAETVLLSLAAVIAIYSMRGGCRHHRQARPIVLMLVGFGLILAGRAYQPDSEWLETLLVVAGAAMIASAHLVNWRLCCGAKQD